MTKRGRKPKAIVIHNDAGTMNSKQYYNNLVNADYNRLARGIAHAYADRNGIWEAISEDRIVGMFLMAFNRVQVILKLMELKLINHCM